MLIKLNLRFPSFGQIIAVYLQHTEIIMYINNQHLDNIRHDFCFLFIKVARVSRRLVSQQLYTRSYSLALSASYGYST